MKTKYFNDAIIGNKNLKATFSKKGELLRLYYPTIDFRQFIDEFMVGIKVNDSRLINLVDDINNVYSQSYVEQTNILNTEIVNTYFNLKIIQTDCVSTKENILIKRYKFINNHNIKLNVDLLLHSRLLSNTNNNVSGIYQNQTLMQYMHDYTLAIFSKKEPLSYQINNTDQNINEGVIGGKDYVGMSVDSSISYNVGEIEPGEEAIIDIILTVHENRKKLEDLEDENIRLKKIDVNKHLEDTKKYWKNYIKKHDIINLPEPINEKERKIKRIYERSILLLPLLYNNETGAISAAAEIDETFSKCGGYSYCWPRDAIITARSMFKIGMEKEIEKFYKNFCNNTQSKNGMWEQRFYTDGKLAPCWGYQIDETASVVFGVFDYYQHKQEIKFLKDNLKMCEKAINYLEKYIENVLNGREHQLSYDIWEECEGIHTYSLAAIFSAFEVMIKINEAVKPLYETNRLKLEQIAKSNEKLEKYLVDIKKYILNNLYDKEKACFVRNTADRKMDISLLGLVYPFNIFSPKEKKMENTIERINMTLRTYTGGYLRYEGDNYRGGNPWIISNLWLAEYYLSAGIKNRARECFDFAIIGSNEHGLLPEQVDNNTMDPAWVVGLGWSHAMFISVLEKLYAK